MTGIVKGDFHYLLIVTKYIRVHESFSKKLLSHFWFIKKVNSFKVDFPYNLKNEVLVRIID